MISKEQTLKMLKNEVCSTCNFYRFKAYTKKSSEGVKWCWKHKDIPEPPTCDEWEKIETAEAASYNPNVAGVTITTANDTTEAGAWSVAISYEDLTKA